MVVLNAPDGFDRALDVEDTVKVYGQLRAAAVDVVVLFVDRVADLEKQFGKITSRMHPEGGLWVAWRKRRPSDVSEDVVRCIARAGGMVDNKVADIDDVWAGIRLVVRVESRRSSAYRAIPRWSRFVRSAGPAAPRCPAPRARARRCAARARSRRADHG